MNIFATVTRMIALGRQEIRNPKFEARNKFKIQMGNGQNQICRVVSNIGILVIRVCFGFRVSDFKFPGWIKPRLAVCCRPAVLLFATFACLGGGFAVCLTAGEPSTFVTATNATPKERAFADADLLDLLTTTLQRDYIGDRGELELRLTRPWATRQIPDEPLSLKVLDLPTSGVASSCIVRFELLAGAHSQGTFQMPVQAKVWREVWVAHAALLRGDAVADADLARERRDVLNIRDPLADFAQPPSTMDLAEPVQAGAPLLARSLKRRPVLRRGQTADAIYQDGALSVTLKVEMMEDGAPGQVVRVRNPVSRRDLRGKVVDETTILVIL